MTTDPPSQRPTWYAPILGIMAASGIGMLFYVVWYVSPFYHPQIEPVVSSLTQIILYLLVFFLAMILWLGQEYDRRLRWAWFLIGLASLANTIAEGLYYYYESLLGVDPFPSLADPFYLIFYPLLLVGLMLLPFAPTDQQERRTLLLDLAIVVTSCAMVFWFFILAPLSIEGVQGLVGFLSLAYPLGDLLVLAGVIAIINRDIERVAQRSLFFLGVGLAAAVLADLLFAYFEINDLPYPYILNTLWAFSALCDLYAIGWQIISGFQVHLSGERVFYRSRQQIRLILPYAAIILGIGLLIFAITQTSQLDLRLLGVLYGVLALIGLVLLRQYLVLRENVSLYERMKHLASTDSLTGIYNRHFFNETFSSEIQRAERYGKLLSVLIIDVDDFKQINDHLGHLQGDQVLKIVASALNTQLRTVDLLARFGGDEFVVILPETGLDDARTAAKRLRNAVTAHSVENQPLSVSIGIASYQPGRTPEQILEEADRDLYRQKGIILPIITGQDGRSPQSDDRAGG